MRDTPLRLLLLPGLDGTGALFEPFVRALSPAIVPQIVRYPTDQPLEHDALEALAARQIPARGPYAILGESFSGPLALRLARRRAGDLAGVILVATFVTSPVPIVPAFAARFVGAWLFRRPTPAFIARHYLVGAGADRVWIERVTANAATVDPSVMAARVRDVLRVDARALLRACPVPLFYLGGGRDALVPPRILRQLVRIRPDLEHATIDAPHLVLQLAPARAAEAIEGFLRRARASTWR